MFHGFRAKKNKKRSIATVCESRIDWLPVGTELHELNGRTLSTLSPWALDNMFDLRTHVIRPTEMITDSRYYEHLNKNTTTITESDNEGMILGSVSTALDGKITFLDETECSSNSCEGKVMPTPDALIQLDTVSLGVSDCEYHGFIATKENNKSKTYVTESRLVEVPVGTELHALNGIPLCLLKPRQVSQMFRERGDVIEPRELITDCNYHGFLATKPHKTGITTIIESNNIAWPIGSVVTALDGISTSTIRPIYMPRMFSSRDKKIVPTIQELPFYKSDCDYHGFVATKSNSHTITRVTQSRLLELPVGTDLYALNGVLVNSLTPFQIANMFGQRSGEIIPKVTQSDCSYHGFRATKTHRDKPTIVIESANPNWVVGSVVVALDGRSTATLSVREISHIFTLRDKKVIPTIDSTDNTTFDAEQYAKALNELTQFQICALCGEEGPPKDSALITECYDLLQKTNINKLYESYTECLTSIGSHNIYDIAYAKEIEYYLPNGLLRGETRICRSCHLTLKKKQNPAGSTETNMNNEQITLTQRKLPKDALINGLMPGHIPLELLNLNLVEQSMISIYSSITKVVLQGGKNYSVHGAIVKLLLYNCK